MCVPVFRFLRLRHPFLGPSRPSRQLLSADREAMENCRGRTRAGVKVTGFKCVNENHEEPHLAPRGGCQTEPPQQHRGEVEQRRGG